jgi:hypothetical protein
MDMVPKGKKTTVLMEFQVTVVSLTNTYAGQEEHPVVVVWKRGNKKENQGSTKSVKVRGASPALFNARYILFCSLCFMFYILFSLKIILSFFLLYYI